MTITKARAILILFLLENAEYSFLDLHAAEKRWWELCVHIIMLLLKIVIVINAKMTKLSSRHKINIHVYPIRISQKLEINFDFQHLNENNQILENFFDSFSIFCFFLEPKSWEKALHRSKSLFMCVSRVDAKTNFLDNVNVNV